MEEISVREFEESGLTTESKTPNLLSKGSLAPPRRRFED
jgi:hypothetical protein